MRFSVLKITLLSLTFVVFFSTVLLLQSCKNDDEVMKSVDLRYRVEDSYLLEAKNPIPISFKVKSTDLWEVFGKHDWYSISPNTGDPGEIYTVTITCDENTGLDDRTDTISVKSDYWTGKTFVIIQKGTAYLNVEEPNTIPQTGGQVTFDVLTNQKWAAKVTEGAKWLSIQGNASGELNGKINVQASLNTGEQRIGIVTIYDRHGNVAREVKCRQGGVILEAEMPANTKWYTVYEEAQQLKIHVESNTEWEVSKQNDKEDDWYTFEKTSFNGSDDLIINIDQHSGISVRTGVIVLATKVKEGNVPITKIIRFKQANPPVAKETEVNKTFTGDYKGPGGLMPGQYNFYVEPLASTQLNLFFSWQGNPTLELRFHILNGKTSLSTTPYCNDVNSGIAGTIRNVDTSKPHKLSLVIKEAVDKLDPTKSWIYTEWILDDVVIAKATSDGIADSNGGKDNWIGSFDRANIGGNFLFRASGGNAVVKKYEYIGPPEWGE